MSLSHDDVLQILALLDASDFDELRLETSDYKLHVRRSAPPPPAGPPATPAAPTNGATSAPEASATRAESDAGAAALPSGVPTTAAGSGANAGPPATTHGANAAVPATPRLGSGPAGLVDVKTPLLGTFYRSPQPGAPPFVDVGTVVDDNTVIGIVEVMKLMSSVLAGSSGVVSEILATDGQLVEYGEVLMRIAPSGA